MTEQSTDGGATGADAALATLLPPLVHEASAAVLVVDLQRREVTFANDLARQLAPERDLPISVDDWSQAAGLEDVTGGHLPEGPTESTVSPAESLLRVAQGEPATGEAITAMRATAATDAREVLWVLGLPLDGAPAALANLALVVFLPARNARLVAGVQESAADLRDRAVLATRVSFTITDPNEPDDPLVWVNPAFSQTTGYTFDEAVGRNCRFLQGEGTDREIIDQIRDCLREERPLTTTLLNYRKDGTPFWNELSISPVRDSDGAVTHFVGVQADVTGRVEAQQSRDDALSQVARAADRLALLADFTSRMAMSQQPTHILQLLADALVPQVGTWCALYTLDDAGHVSRPYVMHERADIDPAVADLVESLTAVVPDQLRGSSPIWPVLRGEVRDVLIRDYEDTPASETGAGDDERTALLRRLGTRSIVVVPLLARSGILGCVALVADESRPPFGETDLALVQDLAVRAGLMLENTQLYARERAAAATLQRSLLPRLPRLDGVTIAAEYIPAADEAAVGGDWYDVFALRGGAGVGVVVGDVMGHNFDSAARMGKLSTIVRSYGWPGSEPQTVLTAVDELLEGGGLDFLATCVYATLSLDERGAQLRYSSAGHPPAIVRGPDGVVHVLDAARGPMIGVSRLLADSTRPADAVVSLERGSTLICFTDGLTDAFGPEPDMDEGLAELCRLAAALPLDASPRQLIERLTAAAVRHSDDVAVVAMRID
ncbi:PAS domain S-box-containing protein [Jatrophihabitans endophyticus]|uniref:PAS domain S-box-containing protein n=1 Tax=Jatrophihabitans endophyticus TaxID=1206085 RepID=A0A1M5I7Y6_9ACTN|nr:SpoIIE family protein phosphatase [Jatrophihabitans endophyticus]SHG24341.1 PAS domain S-box-containing protein [Jatrophihabitans endophyticus]